MKDTQYLSDHFINLPHIIGYLIAAALAWWPGSKLVGRQQASLQRRLIKHTEESLDITRRQIIEAEERVRRMLAMGLAEEIGRLEKLVYILAVMLEQYGLITAVIILKAFFSWVDRPVDSSESGELKDRIAFYRYKLDYYYIYIMGNVLSLLLGVGLGFVGKIVAAFAKDGIEWIIK